MSAFQVDVIRLADGLRETSGVGSIEGCLGEARAIMRRLKRYGETCEVASGSAWQSRRVRVEIVPFQRQPARSIKWTRSEFYKKRLDEVGRKTQQGDGSGY